MAKVPDNLLRDWQDGETITAAEYEQALEILRTAINDNDTNILNRFTKEEVTALLNLKANSSDVYTITELVSTLKGASGADRIKASVIANSPDTVQGILEWLNGKITDATLGQIPDSTIEPKKLTFVPATKTDLDAVKSSVSDGKLLVKNAITGKGGTVLDADGDGFPTHQELADGVNTIQSTLDGSAVDGDVLTGKTYYNTDAKVKRTGTMANRGALSIIPSLIEQIIPSGFHNGLGKVEAIPSNYKRVISGSSTTYNGGDPGTLLAVNNLPFKPRLVYYCYDQGTTDEITCGVMIGAQDEPKGVTTGQGLCLEYVTFPGGSSVNSYALGTNSWRYISNTGFVTVFPKRGVAVKYIAVE